MQATTQRNSELIERRKSVDLVSTQALKTQRISIAISIKHEDMAATYLSRCNKNCFINDVHAYNEIKDNLLGCTSLRLTYRSFSSEHGNDRINQKVKVATPEESYYQSYVKLRVGGAKLNLRSARIFDGGVKSLFVNSKPSQIGHVSSIIVLYVLKRLQRRGILRDNLKQPAAKLEDKLRARLNLMNDVRKLSHSKASEKSFKKTSINYRRGGADNFTLMKIVKLHTLFKPKLIQYLNNTRMSSFNRKPQVPIDSAKGLPKGFLSVLRPDAGPHISSVTQNHEDGSVLLPLLGPQRNPNKGSGVAYLRSKGSIKKSNALSPFVTLKSANHNFYKEGSTAWKQSIVISKELIESGREVRVWLGPSERQPGGMVNKRGSIQFSTLPDYDVSGASIEGSNSSPYGRLKTTMRDLKTSHLKKNFDINMTEGPEEYLLTSPDNPHKDSNPKAFDHGAHNNPRTTSMKSIKRYPPKLQDSHPLLSSQIVADIARKKTLYASSLLKDTNLAAFLSVLTASDSAYKKPNLTIKAFIHKKLDKDFASGTRAVFGNARKPYGELQRQNTK